jgi:hypothetical protein
MLSLGFILWLIFAAQQSGNMLQQQGLLRTGEEIIFMSQKSKRSFLQKFADQQSKLTPKQRQKLIQSRLRAVLVARFLGRQSWQHCPIRIPPYLLRRLMTMGIPRQMMIRSIELPKKPICSYFPFLDSISGLFHPSGFEFNSRNGWTDSFSCGLKQITTHPCKPLVAITGSDGRAWVGRNGDPQGLFVLMHDLNHERNNCATTCAFHPSGNFVAVGVCGFVLVYEISFSLHSISCKLLMSVSFFQDSGIFCTRPPKYAPCEIEWYPTGDSFTAVSKRDGNLSRRFEIDFKTLKAKYEMRHGYLYSFKEGQFAPLCSGISSDGTCVATGYSGGSILVGDSQPLRLMSDDHSIEKIKFDPCNPLIIVIKTITRSMTGHEVHILKISPDGLTINIIYSFQHAESFCFYAGMLIIKYREMITFFRLNGDNFPLKMGEFTSKVGCISSFSFSTLNDVVTLWYSTYCNSKLHKAELIFK